MVAIYSTRGKERQQLRAGSDKLCLIVQVSLISELNSAMWTWMNSILAGAGPWLIEYTNCSPQLQRKDYCVLPKSHDNRNTRSNKLDIVLCVASVSVTSVLLWRLTNAPESRCQHFRSFYLALWEGHTRYTGRVDRRKTPDSHLLTFWNMGTSCSAHIRVSLGRNSKHRGPFLFSRMCCWTTTCRSPCPARRCHALTPCGTLQRAQSLVITSADGCTTSHEHVVLTHSS